MKKTTFTLLFVLLALASAQAQFYGVDINRIDHLLSQLSKLSSDNATMILSTTLSRLEEEPKAYRKAMESIERMGNPVDSLHNEQLYMAGLETATKSFVLSNSEKERYKLLLDYARRNAVGTPATDIVYVTADGTSHHLCEPTQAFTLIFFNGESCDACEKAKKAIENNENLRQNVAKGLIRVLAINTGNSEKQWRKNVLPDWVINGWDKEQQIEGKDTYVLQTNPLFYLLAPDNTVLIKNEPSLKRMERAIDVVLNSNERQSNDLIKKLFNL